MSVEIAASEKTLTAAITGEIDHHTARDIREAIDSAAQRMKPEILALDFSHVGFMDSSGIGLIMGRFRLMSELGGRIELINTPEHVKRMIKLAGLGKLKLKIA